MNLVRLILVRGQRFVNYENTNKFRQAFANNVGNEILMPRSYTTITTDLPSTLIPKQKKKENDSITDTEKSAEDLHNFPSIIAPVLKKRTFRNKGKSQIQTFDISAEGFYNVSSFSTAEEYNLESLVNGLATQDLYAAKKFFSTDPLGVEQDVLYATAKYQVGTENRDIFFFREGSVVLWNFNEIETNNILSFLRQYEKDAYLRPLVRGEAEVMPYTYVPSPSSNEKRELTNKELGNAIFQDGKFFLTGTKDNFLQKYTFSNAMATSTKLGMWETKLGRIIDSMEFLTEDLKKGRRIRISRDAALRKTGELFALRHFINLSSDLLDTPDFYWDREELENLYLQVCSYFSISRRTKVMNEKLNHCVELAELISHNLNDAHHIRLEWMIIILIMVEVGFEIVHYMDRIYSKEDLSIEPTNTSPAYLVS